MTLEAILKGIANIFGLGKREIKSPIPDDVEIARAITPTPTPTPAPQQRKIDFSGYTQQNNLPLTPPNQKLTDLFFKNFPDEATPAAAVTYGENRSYNPRATNINTNGSTDYGLMQINSKTFDDLLRRRPNQMKAIGINKGDPYDVLFDPDINMKVAGLIREDERANQRAYGKDNIQDWGQWYGWKEAPLGIGINLQKMIDELERQNRELSLNK